MENAVSIGEEKKVFPCGSMFGPWGAVAGGIIGGAAGTIAAL